LLRPWSKGETTVVDEIVGQVGETANGLLVPEGLGRETWHAIAGIQRFYLRMLDMETTGTSRLDNYQNFAKAFQVRDYAAVMVSIKPDAARLKSVTEFRPRDLTERNEIGPIPLGALIVAIQEFLAEKPPGSDGQPARCCGGLSGQAPRADGYGRFHWGQGACRGGAPRRRGHRQPYSPPAAIMSETREDRSQTAVIHESDPRCIARDLVDPKQGQGVVAALRQLQGALSIQERGALREKHRERARPKRRGQRSSVVSNASGISMRGCSCTSSSPGYCFIRIKGTGLQGVTP